jgi:hypothetical protein
LPCFIAKDFLIIILKKPDAAFSTFYFCSLMHAITSRKSIITGLSCLTLLFTSCEKVINIDLNNATPRLVVEADISDSPGLLSHHVILSKTNNFSSIGNGIPVTGAMVIIRDSTDGITDTLRETKPGDYVTQKILGISGHMYTLAINTDDKWYHAVSTMPKAISFDSLYTESFSFFGNKIMQFIPVFNDPPAEKNYYRFIVQVNDSLQNDIEAWDDDLTDGKTNSRPINESNGDLFRGNDTVTIEMRCLDKGTFDFFNTVGNASGGAQTPANPETNISNGALGYFGAYTSRRKSIIVP